MTVLVDCSLDQKLQHCAFLCTIRNSQWSHTNSCNPRIQFGGTWFESPILPRCILWYINFCCYARSFSIFIDISGVYFLKPEVVWRLYLCSSPCSSSMARYGAAWKDPEQIHSWFWCYWFGDGSRNRHCSELFLSRRRCCGCRVSKHKFKYHISHN